MEEIGKLYRIGIGSLKPYHARLHTVEHRADMVVYTFTHDHHKPITVFSVGEKKYAVLKNLGPLPATVTPS